MAPLAARRTCAATAAPGQRCARVRSGRTPRRCTGDGEAPREGSRASGPLLPWSSCHGRRRASANGDEHVGDPGDSALGDVGAFNWFPARDSDERGPRSGDADSSRAGSRSRADSLTRTMSATRSPARRLGWPVGPVSVGAAIIDDAARSKPTCGGAAGQSDTREGNRPWGPGGPGDYGRGLRGVVN